MRCVATRLRLVSEWAWWLVAAGLLAAAEVATLTVFFGMLAISALLGAVLALGNVSTPWQFVIALVSAIPLLAVVRPLTLKLFHRNTPELITGTAGYIGRSALVTQTIAPLQPGQVSLLGELWPAVAVTQDITIDIGALVTITALKGSTLTVSPT